jgi:hypothetical protein
MKVGEDEVEVTRSPKYSQRKSTPHEIAVEKIQHQHKLHDLEGK